jgi:uncharacterized protein (TIGR03000 family)
MVLAAVLTTGTGTPAWCHGCHGCYGCGCWGGCYGCYGCGCYGGYGCWGGCYGGYGCGCYGGYSYGCWGCYGGYSYGCYGCYGGYGYGCYGGYGGCGGYVVVEKKSNGQNKKKSQNSTSYARRKKTSDRGTVIVRMPAKAKLYVDNIPYPGAATKHSFVTPRLKRGKKYYYILTAEVVQQGKRIRENKRVLISAGKKVKVNFSNMAAVSTASR